MFNEIPDTIKQYPQWVVWRYEETDGDKPTKVPYAAETGKHANVNNPDTWCSFDLAATTAQRLPQIYAGIGFVLTKNDPFTFIDLDAPKTTNEAEYNAVMDRQRTVFEEFDSYAELSPSGNGLHIIVQGEVESGRKRSSIEVYSSQRFMTMTGNVYRKAPIRDYSDLIKSLWEQMGKTTKAVTYVGNEPEKSTDSEIIQWATNAANGEKFNELFVNGNWQRYYPTQSEADFALINIIAFYTENRPQVQRIFLQSKLAQREKSRAQYRINYMLNRCFDRKLPPIDLAQLKHNLLASLANTHKQAQMNEVANPALADFNFGMPDENPYSMPPGITGLIAQYIYAQSPRPVPEISLAAAIGLMSGICGRAYNVSGTGLNQYLLLIAATGTGKEAIHSGIGKLMTAISKNVPAADEFIGPAEISSAPALSKYLANHSARFVSIVGEFGLALKQLSGANISPHQSQLRRLYLELYQRSGSGSILRPTIYSDKDKNTAAVLSPAFSFIGESTPETFYETLDEDLITEGFLPRMTLIEYNGPRPPENENHINARPSDETVKALCDLCANCLTLDSQNQVINVALDAESTKIFKKLGNFCDDKINATTKEVRRNLWTRATLKAMKLAAIIAVGCNFYQPTITLDVSKWAINIVLADVYNMLSKFDAGDVGSTGEETKQMVRMIDIFRDYISRPWSEIESYKCGTMELHSEKVVPYGYVYKRLSQMAAFTKSKAGTRFAIANTMKTLVERGDIIELPKADVSIKFKTSAACFVITNPKAFGL